MQVWEQGALSAVGNQERRRKEVYDTAARRSDLVRRLCTEGDTMLRVLGVLGPLHPHHRVRRARRGVRTMSDSFANRGEYLSAHYFSEEPENTLKKTKAGVGVTAYETAFSSELSRE